MIRNNIKTAFISVSIVLFAIFSTPFIQSVPAYAAPQKTWDSTDPASEAQAWLYYKVFRSCVASGYFKNSIVSAVDISAKDMSKEDAVNNDWFAEKRSTLVTNTAQSGAILNAVLGDDDGVQGCGGADGKKWIGKLLSSFKYTSGSQFLCDVGFFRDTDQQRATKNADGSFQVDAGICTQTDNVGTNDFNTYDSQDLRLKLLDAQFAKLFKNGSNSPAELASLSPPAQYIVYRDTFIAGGCGVRNGVTTAGSDSLGSANYGIDDMVDSKPVRILYSQGSRDIVSSTPIWAYENVSGGRQINCSDLAKEANIAFPLYKAAVENGQVIPVLGGTLEETSTKGGTSCVIEGIGWLVCALMGAISGVVDGLYNLIQDILTLNPLQQTDSSGNATAQYTTWQNIRNIANILLVIGFIVIIFSQLTSVGVTNYGIKKLLPRVIIVAIAINLSYLVMSAAIDLTNIIGTGIKTIVESVGPNDMLDSVSFESITEAYLTGEGTIAVAGLTAAVVIGAGGLSASALALLAFPFILGALLAVLAAFVTMFIRNALVIVLVVISPIAFAAYLLPNTQSLFDRWRKLFVSMLVLFPMAALLFGGARLAAYITISSDGPLSVLIALFIMAAPLGALPFLIRSSNSVLSGIGNKLQGAAKLARTATQKGLKPFVDQQKAQYRAGERNFMGRRQRPGAARNLAQRFDQSRRSREQETNNSNTVAEENWKEAGIAGTSGSGRRAQRALDAQKTLGTRKNASDAQIEERSKRRIADPTTADAGYEAQSFDAQKGIGAAEAAAKQRNLGRVQTNQFSTSAAANGQRLGTIDNQQFTSEEASKALDLQIKRGNLESGTATVSIQAQKTAELGTKAVEAQDQAEFDVDILHNADTTTSTRVIDAANRESATATAESKQWLSELAEATPGLADLEQRKMAAEDATHLVDKRATADYAESRDSTLAYNVKLAEDRAATAAATDAAAYKETLTDAAIDPTDPLANEIQIARDVALQSRVAAGQSSAADRVSNQQYAEQLQNNPGLAQQVGGIDPQGETLAVAQAIETQRKAYDSNVAAYGVRIRENGTPSSIAPTLGRPDQVGDNSLIGIAMDTARTTEEREAAGRAVVASGDIDSIVPYQNYLATALSNSATGSPEFAAIESLQRAYGENIASSPGKPMGLGAADIAQFKQGNYLPPTPTIKRPVDLSSLSVTDVQTLNTVADKGVSMDNWASMDQKDIGRVADLAQRGLIPEERLSTMWESLDTAMSDVRWYGRIKEREQAQLEALMAPGPNGEPPRIPTPAGRTRSKRK